MNRYGQNSVMHQPCIRSDTSVSPSIQRRSEQHTLNTSGDFLNNTNHKKDYHLYQNYDYNEPNNKSIVSEEQTPLQRPRPPEERLQPKGHDPNDYDEVTPSPELPRRTSSFRNGGQQYSAADLNNTRDLPSRSLTNTPSVPRRSKRDTETSTPSSRRWSNRISDRLSSVIINPFMYVSQKNSSNGYERTRNGYKYETCAITSDDNNMNKIQTLPMQDQMTAKNSYTCRQMCYLVIVPAIILSLIVISLCSLLIYFSMIQVSIKC